MNRLPDTFSSLLEQVAQDRGGGPDVVRSRLAAVRRDRRRMARLERLYGYALRHPAPDRDRVLGEVAGQVLEHGAAYVLGRSSREAQLALSWGHQVYREVHVARRDLRFIRGPGPRQLVAEWHFQFPVVDLVLAAFSTPVARPHAHDSGRAAHLRAGRMRHQPEAGARPRAGGSINLVGAIGR